MPDTSTNRAVTPFMSLSPTLLTATATTKLGVPGYTFGDLHDPERLASLYERFCEEVEAADPALWHEWEAYRSAPDAPRPAIALSNLLVTMAPHVSRFLTRLFQIQPSVDALTHITRDQDDLFRFKVDFVRRRVLPLVKAGAHVVSTPEDEAVVERLIAGADRSPCGQPGPGARRRARRLRGDGRRESRRWQDRLRGRQPQALVRGAAPRSRVSGVGDIPVSRNARLLAPRRRATAAAGPAGVDGRPRRSAAPPRRLHADRRAHEAARRPERDPLLRAVPRARQGLVLERTARPDGEDGHQPARHRARWLPARRKDFRDAHAAEGGRCDRRARARHARQPHVPGHRPSHLQRLHEIVHLPETGAGQHPADRDRRADRRAGDAVGRRDLRAADPVESAQRAAALCAAAQRQDTSSWSASGLRATRSPTIS